MVYAIQEPKHNNHNGTVLATTAVGGAGGFWYAKHHPSKDLFQKIYSLESSTLLSFDINMEKAKEALKKGEITQEGFDHIKRTHDIISDFKANGNFSDTCKYTKEEFNKIQKELAEKIKQVTSEIPANVRNKLESLQILDKEKRITSSKGTKLLKSLMGTAFKNTGKFVGIGALIGFAAGLLINSMRNNN